MADEGFEVHVVRVAALAEPQRRAIYQFVVGRDGPVSKDDAAAALGVARSVAAFHLDRLVADGLLSTEFRRLSGRRGPGAGRPAKLYRRAAREVAVSLPPRHYGFVADLLATAVEASAGDGTPVADALRDAARHRGADLGAAVRGRAGDRPSRGALAATALALLEEQGYEPRMEDGQVVLVNCPFHALADRHRELVCGMNHDLLAAVSDAVGDDVLEAHLVPTEGRCCVRLDVDRRALAALRRGRAGEGPGRAE